MNHEKTPFENEPNMQIDASVPKAFERDYDDATVSAAASSADIPTNVPQHVNAPQSAPQNIPTPQNVYASTPPASRAPSHMEKKKRSKLPLILSLVGVTLILVVVGGFFLTRYLTGQIGDTRETVFKEEKTEKIQHGEVIEINDPELGVIEIEAVPGAPKNNYNDENFKLDENGFLAYYIDGEKASCIGVDLSEYQGDIDFEAMKNAGVDYVMLRIGGRYYGDEGELFDDKAFDDYYQQAKAAGLKVGAYFFSQAISAEEGKEEAEHVISRLDGKKLDYPIAFDWEVIADDDARTDSVDGETLTDIAESFYDTLKEGGYNAIIYTNTSLMYYRYDLARMKDYEFWVADYGDLPSMYYGFTMWQYTTEGTVNGVDGTVDLNICFKNY